MSNANMRKGPGTEAQNSSCEIKLGSALPTPEEDRIQNICRNTRKIHPRRAHHWVGVCCQQAESTGEPAPLCAVREKWWEGGGTLSQVFECHLCCVPLPSAVIAVPHL